MHPSFQELSNININTLGLLYLTSERDPVNSNHFFLLDYLCRGLLLQDKKGREQIMARSEVNSKHSDFRVYATESFGKEFWVGIISWTKERSIGSDLDQFLELLSMKATEQRNNVKILLSNEGVGQALDINETLERLKDIYHPALYFKYSTSSFN